MKFKSRIYQAIFLVAQPKGLIDPTTEKDVLWIMAALVIGYFLLTIAKDRRA